MNSSAALVVLPSGRHVALYERMVACSRMNTLSYQRFTESSCSDVGNGQCFFFIFEKDETFDGSRFCQISMTPTQNLTVVDFQIRIHGRRVKFSESHASEKKWLDSLTHCEDTNIMGVSGDICSQRNKS